MNKLKTVFRALVGYAGSSENPTKMSLRFLAVITAVVSQFGPIISYVVFLVSGEQFNQNEFTAVIEPVTLVVASVMWLVGAFRAVLNTPTVAGFLKKG